MYNLHYVPTTWGYKVEEKLYLGVREQKRLNTIVLKHDVIMIMIWLTQKQTFDKFGVLRGEVKLFVTYIELFHPVATPAV
jgi:hypothetical protein